MNSGLHANASKPRGEKKPKKVKEASTDGPLEVRIDFPSAI